MKKSALPYWNHNAAYYPRLRRILAGRRRILDVGCGDGALACFLREDGREVVGIDPEDSCIRRTRENAARLGGADARTDGELTFFPCTLEEYAKGEHMFDSVIFVASLHHMDGEKAISLALRLLRPDGMLCIVGLAKPSSVWDFFLEGLRFLPCFLAARFHKMKSTEQLGIPVSYELPTMDEVRRLLAGCLPGAKLRQGLYYRWLAVFEKPE